MDTSENSNWSPVWMAASAVFVLALIGGAIFLAADSEQGTPATDSLSVAAAPSATPTTDTSKQTDECEDRRRRSPSDIPEESPKTKWESWRGTLLASSEDFGPFEESSNGDVASCFARTPGGALLALQQGSVRLLFPRNIVETTKLLTVEGPGQTRRIAAMEERGVILEAKPGELCQFAGFRFVDYSNEEAVIDAASRCPSGTLASTQIKMVWSKDDWRLQLTLDGGAAFSRTPIDSLAGFVAWGAT